MGPFGDIKNYDGRNLYFSWYDAGLLVEGTALAPPPVPALDAPAEKALCERTFRQLGGLIPELEDMQDKIESLQVRGGWVYAAGTGALGDRRSGLHRRADVGIVQRDGYFSVDTGKYSIAPWLARQVADAVMAVR